MTRRPLVLQLHKTEEGKEYGEFLHLPKKKFYDFGKSSFWVLSVQKTEVSELECYVSL